MASKSVVEEILWQSKLKWSLQERTVRRLWLKMTLFLSCVWILQVKGLDISGQESVKKTRIIKMAAGRRQQGHFGVNLLVFLRIDLKWNCDEVHRGRYCCDSWSRCVVSNILKYFPVMTVFFSSNGQNYDHKYFFTRQTEDKFSISLHKIIVRNLLFRKMCNFVWLKVLNKRMKEKHIWRWKFCRKTPLPLSPLGVNKFYGCFNPKIIFRNTRRILSLFFPIRTDSAVPLVLKKFIRLVAGIVTISISGKQSVDCMTGKPNISKRWRVTATFLPLLIIWPKQATGLNGITLTF